MSVFIIAEAGSTPGGDLDRMKQSIEAAKIAGADAWKAQWTSSPTQLAARRHADEYVDAYRALAFPREWFPDLKAACDAAGLAFLCTVYLPGDIQVVAPHVERFKVASLEASDAAFVASHVPYSKPLIVSTGLMTARRSGRILVDLGLRPYAKTLDLTLLHCLVAYPAPLAEANLAAIGWMQRDLRHAGYATKVGWSDHTGLVPMGGWAVAAGADVVEVHFKLDDTPEDNPDFPHSLTPADLAVYIDLAREAELARGSGAKIPQPSEFQNLKFQVRP